jgi:hypothetical protein
MGCCTALWEKHYDENSLAHFVTVSDPCCAQGDIHLSLCLMKLAPSYENVREMEVQNHVFLTLALDVSSQLHALAALLPGKEPPTFIG